MAPDRRAGAGDAVLIEPLLRMRVAYYSPLPPSRSGIADYSALLLPALRDRMDVALAEPRFRRRRPAADVALYHVGNDPAAHGWIVEELRRRPGVVVLHEFVLHHLVAGITLARGDAAGYLAAMERDHGLAGRLLAYGVLDNRIPPLWETRPQDFPLAGEILRLAQALVVHSEHVERRAREAGYGGPIHRIPHPAWPAPAAEPAHVEGAPLIGCFGHQNESKRVPQLYAALDRLRERRPDARLLFVGSATPRVAAVPSPAGTTREDYVDEARLWSLMAAADVVVSLRSPTMGETSGTVIRALSLGKPLVVSDVGWFSELPDEVAIKIRPDEREVPALEAALERLAGDGDLRSEMGAAARALAESAHGVERVADLYVSALEQTAGGDAVRDAVALEVANAAAEVGVDDAAELARRLEEVGLDR
jgi:glycosyltransferase involved in cell wall biosynthesis